MRAQVSIEQGGSLSTLSVPEIDRILKNRYHGAANIAGIRFQILYSVLRAFEVYDEDAHVEEIRLEGIEDIDLIGLRVHDEFVQVKTREKPWHWSELKDPLGKFLEVYRVEPNYRFTLAVGFQLKGDLAKLAQFKAFSARDSAKVERKFASLCQQVGATPQEATALLMKLTIISIPEPELLNELQSLLSESYGINSEAVNVYMAVLVSRFLEWASQRKTLDRCDLDEIRAQIGEAIASEAEFQAYGKGLIDRVDWTVDDRTEDFYDGKGCRPGHVAAGLDVERPQWMDRIDLAMRAAKVCMIRSASGQGKSTLLYRYAFQHWPHENTFILRTAETSEHIDLLNKYLSFRARLGRPVLLLIDDAGWPRRLWPELARRCAALGIRVLVSIRNEDWARFARESLTGFEVVKPELNLDEAREIFRSLHSQGRVYESVKSAAWAFEKLGEPPLLMEYVYLVTRGKALEERLRDQIRQISEQSEDPAKLEILRRTAIAHKYSVPTIAAVMLESISLRDDPQIVLESLAGEYFEIDGDLIAPLHPVRASHLSRILHETHPRHVDSALAVLDSIPSEALASFVANALCDDAIARDDFIAGLVEKAQHQSLRRMLATVDGMFEAGERAFLTTNMAVFREASELKGPVGPWLLKAELTPILYKNILERTVSLASGEKGESLQKLKDLADGIKASPRGLAYVRRYLEKVVWIITPEMIKNDIGNGGVLLDWCGLVGVRIPALDENGLDVFQGFSLADIGTEDLCRVAQGLHRYEPPLYEEWLSSRRDQLLSYLKLTLECVDVRLGKRSVSIEFFPDPTSELDPNDQCIERLRKLRSVFPFCERYESRGIWALPFGLLPSKDPSRKKIPAENLPLESDLAKVGIWGRVVDAVFLPDNYYSYEKDWYGLRRDALSLVKRFVKGLTYVLAGKTYDFHRAVQKGGLPDRVFNGTLRVPEPPPQTTKEIRDLHFDGSEKWASNLRNFFNWLVEHKEGRADGKMAIYCYKEAVRGLSAMHSAYDELFKIVPDYFAARDLNSDETRHYKQLTDLLELWIEEKPGRSIINIRKFIEERREKKRTEIIQQIRCAISGIEGTKTQIILPSDLHIEHPLRYLPLAFVAKDPAFPEDELEPLIKSLRHVKDVADFFCLVPVHDNHRFMRDGYLLSSGQVEKLLTGRKAGWESLAPCELPAEAMKLLPEFSFISSPGYEFRVGALSLIGALDSFRQQLRRIQRFRRSRNTFEVELYGRLAKKILASCTIQLDSASNLEQFLVEASTACKEHDRLLSLVGDFANAVNEDSVEDYIFSSAFKPRDLIRAVDQFLKKRNESSE